MRSPAETQPIVVIGAGPKGVALWTKHVAMSLASVSLPPIAIVERKTLASHWRGDDGFTDGFQLLVSPSEQDLGYPYAVNHQNRETALKIRDHMVQYSWMQYLVSNNAFCDWVSKDRPRSSHQQLVDYLAWAADKSNLKIITASITGAKISDGSWVITTNCPGVSITAQALVVTGTGSPRRIDNQPSHPQLFDGKSFWDNLDKFDGLSYSRIAVIGAGETAAAIAAAIVDKIVDPSTCCIDLVCKQNAYFTRAQVMKDLRYFSDPTGWTDLSKGRRLSIIRRADRGVVSASIKAKLEDNEAVGYTNAEVISIVSTSNTDLNLTLRYEDGDIETLPYHYIIVATGFDALWFLELLDESSRSALLQHLIELMPDQVTELRNRLKMPTNDAELLNAIFANRHEKNASKLLDRLFSELIEPDLSVREFKPRLHLPMISGLSQGPGFPNLNCLGLLSDRILGAYVRS